MLILPFRSNLAGALSSAQAVIALQDSLTDLCLALAAPAHAFAQVYSIHGSETVLVQACENGKLTVTRGVSGTTAKAWPSGACFKITEIEPGAVCGEAQEEGTLCDVFDPQENLLLGPGLMWDTSEAGSIKLSLSPTGVVPTNMSCGTVDKFGRLVSIPNNWPATCLTPFDPCCDGSTNGGGAISACDVSYATTSGSGVVTATDVCGALDQLADAVAGASGGSGTGVLNILEGSCIDITGSATNPVIGVSPTGITPGVYAGFTINACGQISAYAASEASMLQITGTNPVVASLTGGAYTISVLTAGIDQLGVVKLADPVQAVATPPVLGDDDVITWEFFEAYQAAQVSGVLAITGEEPIVVTLVDDDYEISVLPAGVGELGVVTLTDAGEAANPVPDLAADDVVTWEFLEAYLTAKGII